MALKNIQRILESKEFTCSLFSADKETPFDRLLVFLNLDLKKRERLLEITVAENPISPEFTLPQAILLPSRIQFRVELPFQIEDMALNQVASLLHFLNRLIDLPGFELDELTGKVVYRYAWVINQELIDATMVMSITSAILLNLSLFSETIESLADGHISFNDLLTQITHIADSHK